MQRGMEGGMDEGTHGPGGGTGTGWLGDSRGDGWDQREGAQAGPPSWWGALSCPRGGFSAAPAAN